LARAYCRVNRARRRSIILAPGPNLRLKQEAKDFAQIVSEAANRSDEDGRIDIGVLLALGTSGLAMAPFHPSFQGAGLGLPDSQNTLCTILRLVGAADLSVARLFEGHVNAIMLVSKYGTPTQIESLASSTRAGGLSGVWGAEDAVGLRRVHSGASWSLQGRKVLASGVEFISRPLVTVSTADGHLLYLLEMTSPERVNTSSWTPLGMKASGSGTIDLTGVVVGDFEQVGQAGDYMRQPMFSGGAWRFCAAQLGAAERLTKLFCEQLRSRGRQDDPYQLERVAACAAACGTALFWIEEASRRFADGSLEPAAVVAFVNMTRIVTERAALDVIQNVQRGLGLSGFMKPNPIERICRDLSTYLRQPVPDLAMSDAARAVLAGDLKVGVVA
jgi:alkylation response protein AidB-like acyl-CoA dehydrogenase